MAVQTNTEKRPKAERVYPGQDIAETLPDDQVQFLSDPYQYWALDGV